MSEQLEQDGPAEEVRPSAPPRRRPPQDDCSRCGHAQSVNYGSRCSCRRCGATWQTR